mgnify:FL=1
MQNYDGQFKLNGQEYFYRAKDDSESSKITRVNNEEHHYRMVEITNKETGNYDVMMISTGDSFTMFHRAAGPELLAECRTLHGCETGEAKITKAYNLPCDYVIHTVGSIWNGGRNREEELLANCYFNSMKLAMDNGIRSIAFPSISTGVYSFPVELAAKIAVHTVNRFLQDKPDWFDLVEWVLFDTHTESVYESEVDKIY